MTKITNDTIAHIIGKKAVKINILLSETPFILTTAGGKMSGNFLCCRTGYYWDLL